jgi:hypothetical protein
MAQETWVQQWKIAMDSSSIWDIDPLNQTYIFQQQNIQKLNSVGKVILAESNKSYGNTEKIDAQNSLKIAFFSESQQRICFLDNALALQQNCINLSDLDINLGTAVSASGQTDRIWIYDEPSQLIELVTLRTNQGQLIQNINRLLGFKNISEIQEINNKLYIFGNDFQVAWLDQYGNFIDAITLPQNKGVYPLETTFLYAQGKKILAFNPVDETSLSFFDGTTLLDSPIRKLKVNTDLLFIQTSTSYYCFKISVQQSSAE